MTNIIRPLSIHEASFPIYGDLTPGGGNIVVCLNLTGELSAEKAKQGLQQLSQAEASLRAAIQQADNPKKGYNFIELNNFDLPFSHHDIGETSCSGKTALQTEIDKIRTQFLNQSFQLGHLLWRAHLVSDHQQHCLILCINHSVSDGSSVYHLMKRWLLALNSATDIKATKNEFPSALWQHMPKRIANLAGAFRSLSVLATFIKAQKLADKGLSFKSEGNVPIAEHRCRSTYRSLDKTDFTSLLNYSKSKQQGLHGLLSSCLLQVFLEDCKQRRALDSLAKVFTLPFVTTINARDKFNSNKKSQAVSHVDNAISGCLSSGVTSLVQVDQALIDNDYKKQPWQLGEQVSSGVKQALQQDQHWKVLRIYQLAGLKGLKKMFIDSSEKPLATPISFANLGQVDFDFYINRAAENNCQPLTVKDYQAYAAFHASGAGINVVASSLKGALTLCFTCPSPVISQKTMNDYADAVVQRLTAWANEQENQEEQVRKIC